MKTLIIYVSVHHGNTGKVASAIAEAIHAELLPASDSNQIGIDAFDCLGFGSGIFYGKHHRKLFQIVEALSTGRGRKAFVFSTSGSGSRRSNRRLIAALENKGFEVIGSFACKGYDTWGPFKWLGGLAKNRPNLNDLEKAKTFAKKILA